MKPLRVLGIETSCDETSVALLSVDDADAAAVVVELVHHEIATQIPIHQRFGGVVPEVAARMHVAELVSLLERARIFDAEHTPFDAIAVTQGPGLATALRVGIEAARTIAALTGKPIIGVNHLEGHIASAWLLKKNRTHWAFPMLVLLVSGGHTELVLMKDFCSYKVLGRTRDDAAGEAFDKTAKLMGLGYPGGPMIAQYAQGGDATSFALPRPMLKDKSLDMSFSGLKTAVRLVWESLTEEQKKDQQTISNLCASIQQAITDVLIAKTMGAARKYAPKTICMVGGVSANAHLQESLATAVTEELPGTFLLDPAKGLHTDNAAMIAAAGVWRLLKGKKSNWKTLDADPELDF